MPSPLSHHEAASLKRGVSRKSYVPGMKSMNTKQNARSIHSSARTSERRAAKPCTEKMRLMQCTGSDPAWKKWGPYLSERQWGTVREDYSPHGNAWDYFPHDHARSRTYRWGEDGIAGFSDHE